MRHGRVGSTYSMTLLSSSVQDLSTMIDGPTKNNHKGRSPHRFISFEDSGLGWVLVRPILVSNVQIEAQSTSQYSTFDTACPEFLTGWPCAMLLSTWSAWECVRAGLCAWYLVAAPMMAPSMRYGRNHYKFKLTGALACPSTMVDEAP